jgi:predicted SAM-dependent methyltransferase
MGSMGGVNDWGWCVKVNVGCGTKLLDGYVNCDAAPRPGVDHVCRADALPFGVATADEVMAIHLVEHVYAWEVPALLREWARVLKPGGRLVLELPDIMKAAKNLAEDRRDGKHPDQMQMWAIYGDDRLQDPLMMHRAGWWFERLRPVVEAAGFTDVVERNTKFHPCGRKIRDFRLEAVRK